MKFRDLVPPAIWLEEELMATLSAEIQKEMDAEIMKELMKIAHPVYPEIKQK